MSIEGGGPIIEHPSSPVTSPAVAVGEFLFSPDVWKTGLEVVVSTSRVLSMAVGSITRLVALPTGRLADTGLKNIDPTIPQTVNPGIQGGGI